MLLANFVGSEKWTERMPTALPELNRGEDTTA
jgi:hypothetical protein